MKDMTNVMNSNFKYKQKFTNEIITFSKDIKTQNRHRHVLIVLRTSLCFLY